MENDVQQVELFHEDIYDALRDVVKALGGNKHVGADMQPEKLAHQAGTWLANCLDATRPEKLDLDQMLYLIKRGREIGCHVGIAYICQQAGYSYQPIEPEDEQAALQREFIQSVKQLKHIKSRLESLSHPVRAVKA